MRSRAPRTLTNKRNALAYEREQLKTRIVEVGKEIAAIDYTLRLLEPNWSPPKKTFRPGRSPRLPRGVVQRTVLQLLRSQPDIDTTTLAELTAKRCNLPLPTKEARQSFASTVAMTLRRYERRGLLEITGKDSSTGAIHWRIRPDNDELPRAGRSH
jgi:hypothetical protein